MMSRVEDDITMEENHKQSWNWCYKERKWWVELKLILQEKKMMSRVEVDVTKEENDE